MESRAIHAGNTWERSAMRTSRPRRSSSRKLPPPSITRRSFVGRAAAASLLAGAAPPRVVFAQSRIPRSPRDLPSLDGHVLLDEADSLRASGPAAVDRRWLARSEDLVNSDQRFVAALAGSRWQGLSAVLSNSAQAATTIVVHGAAVVTVDAGDSVIYDVTVVGRWEATACVSSPLPE
jgi:hypothetical protein